MAVSPEVEDWLVCCDCEQDAPKFVNSGVDSINKLRNLPEDQFRKIGLPSWINRKFRQLQDRTSTVEKLSQEVSVSTINTITTNIPWSVCGCQSFGWYAIIFTISCNWLSKASKSFKLGNSRIYFPSPDLYTSCFYV